MLVAMLLLGVVVVMGIWSALGRGADSRDPDYSMGKVMGWKPGNGQRS